MTTPPCAQDGSCQGVPATAQCDGCGNAYCVAHAEKHFCDSNTPTNTVEFNSDWGRMVLAEGDFRMHTPAYQEFVRSIAYLHARPSYDEQAEKDWLTHRLHYPLDEQLSRLSGDRMTIVALTGTCGSDANNVLVQLARVWVNRGTTGAASAGRPRKQACVLVMEEGTVSARGELVHFSSRKEFVRTAAGYRPAELTTEVRHCYSTYITYIHIHHRKHGVWTVATLCGHCVCYP